MPRTAMNSRRSRTSCSILALATVMAVGATPAAAQSLLGTGTYATNPNATGIVTAPNTTTINLNGGQTVINWTPTDNAVGTGTNINFQNAGTTATFTSTQNFSVLNNINQADIGRAIAMNGTVNSLVNGSQGGSVYFYSPGGFVFGGGSAFNVGSLVVSALPIQWSANGFIANEGTDNTVVFGQAPNPSAAISSNGTINANIPAFGVGGAAGDSYVAMVAPLVTHSGSISVNGSAALVAAEAATISFSTDGLFDIEVTTGTTSTSGVEVNGDIGGPTPDSSTDKQGIYLVAVPKNDALTMVISNGADLGFTLANDATIDDNGVVVLSAGHDIVNGQIGGRSAGHGADAAANFSFTGAHATNNLFGEATGTADLYSVIGNETTTFDSDVTVHAAESVRMGVSGVGTSLSVGGDLSLSADISGVDGQDVTAGFAELYAFNDGDVSVTGNASLTADGFGGASGESVGAGAGTGGTVSVTASDGASITIGNSDIGGNVFLSASGNGGTGFDGGSGNGTGGTVSIQVSNDGDISIFGETEAYAEGRGGTNWDSGANGGTGQGGDIFVGATGTGSTLSLTGALMSANGIGGGAGEGTCCAAIGGAGIGGLVSVFASTGALIQSNGTLEFSAAGEGALASGAGGSGTGGQNGDGVFVTTQSGATLDVTGSLWLDATGSGGDGEDSGGNGTGGHAALYVDGGTVDVSDEINVDADGFGGDSYYGGNGGIATGGLAEVATNGSGAQLNALNVLIEADATGGESFNFSEGPLGDGGDAFGGRTRASANDGSIHITGDLTMTATSTGGFGANGGDATGIVTPSTNEGLPPAAFVWAGASTGELRVDGLTDIDVSATGGGGSNGNGGNASAGEIDIVSQHGDMLLSDVTGNADALGGAGGFGGGSGGNAFGGAIDVSWAIDQTTGLSGLISMATVALSANGTGGDGGEGMFVQGGPGGTGGDGGSGTGGGVSYVGSAGGGTLDVGSTTIEANGFGGSGGSGGSGDIGGNGGAGGNATGGFIQTGTISNDLSTTSGGTATFTFLSASANASGGVGGDGGEGVNGFGLGGDGGDATGGEASFLVRGISVTADSVNLYANASGGNGGFGSVNGNGGNASTGFVYVESKDRFGHPTERGTLTASSITGTVIATGGIGNVNGSSTVRGGSYFRVLNGDADIGSVTFNFVGDLYDGTAGPNYIQAEDGTATVGTFGYSTTGELAIYTTDTGSLDIGALTLNAGNFIDHPTLVGPDVPGTIYADSLSVTSGGDFIADAHLDVDNGIAITVPGSIRFFNAVTSSNVDLSAGGSLSVDAVDADGFVELSAFDAIDTSNINAGSYVDIYSEASSIGVGHIDAGGSVSLSAGTFIEGDDISAGGSIFAQTFGGDIGLGTLTSSFGSISLNADGDIWVSGDATADGDIDLTANGNIVMQNATAGESIELDAGGYLDSGGGYVDGLDLTAGDSIDVLAAEWVELGNLSAGLVDPSFNEAAEYSARVVAGGDILAGNIAVAQDIGLATPGAMTTGDIDAGGIFMALGHGDMSFGDATASEVFLSDYAVLNLGGLTATCIGACGALGADGVVTAPPTGPSYAYVTTDGGVDGAGQLSGEGGTNGSVYTTSEFAVAAGEALDFWFNYVTSDGSGFADYAWAALLTPNLDPVAILFTARTQPSGTIVPGQDLPGVEATLDPLSVPIIGGAPEWSALGADSGTCFADGCGFTGWVSSSYDIADAGTYVLRFGVTNWTDAGFQSGMAFSGLSIGGVSLTPTLLTRTGGSISIGDVNAGKFSAAAGTSLTTGIIDSSGSITLDANGAITTGNLFAGDFVLGNGGSITTGNIEANSVEMASTGGNITSGDIFAFGDVELDAFGGILTGDIAAGSIDLAASGDINTGDLTTQQLVLAAQFDGGFTTMLYPGASITLESGGDISTGNIDSIDGVYANAGGSISTGWIEANDFVELHSGTFTDTGYIDAGSYILADAGGDIDTGDLSAGFEIDLDSGGNIEFGNADAGVEFEFEATGSVNGGDILAGLTIEGEAGGSVTLGDLTAGFESNEAIDDDTFSVGIQAIGPISVGDVQGANRVGFATLGDLTTGSIETGWDFFAVADGDIVTGAITTGEGDQVFMSGTEAFFAAGGGEDSDFDPEMALAGEPTPTGGSITINGPVSTGLFRAAAGTGLTAQAIAADAIEASAGGTATVGGAWAASDIELASNDIDITATGSMDASGILALFSTNATQALIGDGLAGSGYALSNAEFGRLEGGSVYILARGDASAAQDMLIGDLAVTGSSAGSTIESPDGILVFAVGDLGSGTPNGVIRVVGDVNATGFGSANAMEFYADRFELDAATGSISIFSSGNTLGGELGLYADRIHVAEATILNQLATNPTYTGYEQDLNEEPTVQRPEGVLRADTIWIESDNLQSVLIQNTGTFETRAGFLARQAFINDDSEVAGPPGSINLIVNGQVVTEGGTLTGIEARDALIDEETDITPFTSNSTINGCPLTGACIIAPPPPPPTVDVVDNQFDLINGNPFGDSEFDDTQEGEEGSSNPISPPQPLFDTRPLIPSGDVDDPVSGTGNPALLGSTECVDDDETQCGTEKESSQ